MTNIFNYFRQRVRGEGSHARPKETEVRQKLKKELYEFNQCAVYGFPSKPSALCYDPKLHLLAIATKSGVVRVYGAPGVEFYGQHADTSEPTVTQMFFLPGEGRLVTLTSDNVLHLWEINTKDLGTSAILEETKCFTQFDSEASKQKTISACIPLDGSRLLLGTEGGNIHLLDVATFNLLPEQIIYQDVIMHHVPDDFKVNPGAVEAIAQHPQQPSRFLIGYNRGLIVLWDIATNKAELTFNASQQLEALSWSRNGTEFLSAHADGSYIVWSVDDSTKPKEQSVTPYGPFPCKAITKIQWKITKAGEDPLIIFSGGLPRANYGDRHTVSVIQGDKHVTFDFTSRVIDFFTINSASEEIPDVDQPGGCSCKGNDGTHTLVVLLDEEIVAIDLLTKGWPMFRLPYLNSLHSSAITASNHVANVPDSLWNKIVSAGAAQFDKYSQREWPINGGEAGEGRGNGGSSGHDLLLTGHEDGSVRFWDASATLGMPLLYKLDTAGLFVEGYREQDTSAAADEEDWPPFRKSGHFDPYSDDPRLGVQKVFLCPLSDMMVVAGTAGQIILLQLEREERQQEVKGYHVNVVSDRENFVWKGHEALTLREGESSYGAGFQPHGVLQMTPPAACTALSVHSEWQLLASGTAHGFVVFDFRQRRVLASKCTLGSLETAATDDSAMSRHKTFKQSLRESFRRLRRRRSVSKKGGREDVGGGDRMSPMTMPGTGAAMPRTAADAAANRSADSVGRPLMPASGAQHARVLGSAEDEDGPLPSVERAVEARPSPQQAVGSSMVRVLTFADTFLLSATTHSACLWVGTNAGYVYVYVITLPANDKRDSKEATAQLAKEVHLKHRAPVVSLAVVDRNYYPLPSALEVQNERARAPDMTGGHHLVVISEEQFKVFSLPTLKPEDKWKLTAHEGMRVRKIGYVTFRSRSDDSYCENNVVCLTNHGDFSIYTVRGLRRQLQKAVVSITDITAIATCIFTSSGQGFYQTSSSECARFSLSAAAAAQRQCTVRFNESGRSRASPSATSNKAGDRLLGDQTTITAAVVQSDVGSKIVVAHSSPSDVQAGKRDSANHAADKSSTRVPSTQIGGAPAVAGVVAEEDSDFNERRIDELKIVEEDDEE